MCAIFLIFVIGAFAVFIFFFVMMMNATSDASSSGSVSMGQFLPFIFLPMFLFLAIVIIGGGFLFFAFKRRQKSVQGTISNQMNQFIPSSRFQDIISCDQCGAVLQPTEKFCPTCGRRTRDDFG
jgi:NADH:ubiquinone oxidoreductase subunit 6 (subunit J)